MERRKRRKPQLNLYQPPEPEPTMLENGAFGKIRLSGQSLEVTDDMIVGGVRINGEGQSVVYRITINGIVMARKHVRVSMDAGSSREEINLMLEKKMREVYVIKGCANCPFIVHFYGFYVNRVRDCVNIHIFMEELALSASTLIKRCKEKGKSIPEFIIGRIACSVTSALFFLKTKMQMIHRDVKPSNILIDNDGRVKICDFGISGILQNSVAISIVGCQQYTAPEIAKVAFRSSGYSVKSDIWSLGITVYELSTLQVPYPEASGIPLGGAINDCDPPRLDPAKFSANLVEFVRSLLQIDANKRPHFDDVKNLAFFKQHDVPFSCIGTGVGVPDNHSEERPSVGAWLDNFLFRDR
uniref:mitogen-activated protein kinase kinase n=1 Tax=Caenorhabditis japonica TaxID=281687 RepID=A0A8R1E2C2_CAEJA